jgi:hypothetical protein
MPVAKIQAPDGQIITLEVPEGATQEQILQFVASQQGVQSAPQLTPEQQAIKQDAEAKIQSIQGDLDRLNQVRQNPDLLEQVFGGVEGFLAVGSGLVSGPISGIAGLADAANPFAPEFAGAARQKQVQEALTFEPKLRTGQGAVQDVVETLQPITEGLETVRGNVGDDVLNKTGSPFVAAIASALPDATLSLLGVKQLTGVKGLPGQSAASTAAQQQATRATVDKFSKLQTPAKQKLSQMIAEGSTDADVAGVKLSANNLKSKITDGLPRVVKDPIAQNAIDKGLDAATTSMIKASRPLERQKFLKMLEIAEKSLKNRKFGAQNRVGDVAGESLLQRVKAVNQINKRSGQSLDKIASSKAFRSQSIDKASAFDDFAKELQRLDIKLDRGGKRLNFADSAIEGGVSGASSAQKILSLTLKRFNAIKNSGNALELHKLKRFIDKQVTFGKTPTGTAGAAEAPLKALRRAIDEALDSKLPAYKKANDVFSQTRGSLDDFQKAAGTNLNLTGGQADKALGVKLRSLTNNTQTRANLIESMAKLEDAAISNGVKFKDRILDQVLFADDIETLLKIAPKTGLKGQATQAIADAATGSTTQAGITTAKTLVDKLKGTTPEKTIQAIRELLEDLK